jgi:hypothetical protein
VKLTPSASMATSLRDQGGDGVVSTGPGA